MLFNGIQNHVVYVFLKNMCTCNPCQYWNTVACSDYEFHTMNTVVFHIFFFYLAKESHMFEIQMHFMLFALISSWVNILTVVIAFDVNKSWGQRWMCAHFSVLCVYNCTWWIIKTAALLQSVLSVVWFECEHFAGGTFNTEVRCLSYCTWQCFWTIIT